METVAHHRAQARYFLHRARDAPSPPAKPRTPSPSPPVDAAPG